MDLEKFCFCAKLRKASRVVTAIYDGFLAETGLKITQFSLLVNVKRLEKTTAARLAQLLLMDKTTLSRNLRLLIQKGLLAERPGQDKRAKELSLTPAGEEALLRTAPHWRAAQRHLRDLAGQQRLDRLFDDLTFLEERD